MANTYNFLREVDPFVGKVDPTSTIEQGDLVMFDSGVFKRLAAAANSAKFAGVAQGAVPISSNIDNVPTLVDSVLIKNTGVFDFKCTVGETYANGDIVQRGADDQTIALVGSPAYPVGKVFLPVDATIATATAGQKVPVKITPLFYA